LHAADDERFDLVHVEAFVDPGHEQELGPIGLGADLARLARRDRGGIGDERQHAERRLGERFLARRPPRPDPDVRFDLELLEAGNGHCYWGTPSASPKPPLRAVDLHGFDVALGSTSRWVPLPALALPRFAPHWASLRFCCAAPPL